MSSEAWMQAELDGLSEQHLRRGLEVQPQAGGVIVDRGRRVLNFSSNDYLDLARRPAVVEQARRALAEYGCGACASRLVSGSLPLHAELEGAVAAHKGYPASLVFGCGFLTNVGVISALVGRNDTVFADKLVHASLIDAIVLSRATLVRFRHNDSEHLAAQLAKNDDAGGRRLIVTESVFSMDGDIAPLAEIAALSERHGALLMVDEAHSSGVFGPHGAGLVRENELADRVNISMGTFSKALGNYGGFVACSETMREWLINRARSFIYTTALPPAVLGGCLGALEVLDNEPELGEKLRLRSDFFRNLLRERGFDTGRSASQIIPVMVGESARALELARQLNDCGVVAVAIRPPTVPRGTARLRLSVTLAHTRED
ncbi:MAG: 8-amino-7-oxononanoate synthase, partial [bacterium]